MNLGAWIVVFRSVCHPTTKKPGHGDRNSLRLFHYPGPCHLDLGIDTLRVPRLPFLLCPGSPVTTSSQPRSPPPHTLRPQQDIARPASQDRRFLNHWRLSAEFPIPTYSVPVLRSAHLGRLVHNSTQLMSHSLFPVR